MKLPPDGFGIGSAERSLYKAAGLMGKQIALTCFQGF